MEQLVLTKKDKINEVISKLLYKTVALSALVVQDNGKIENFAHIAETVVDDLAILNILIAPDGIVSEVYPLKGNEKLIGFDMLKINLDGNKEAIAAKEMGELVLGGPFHLMQGGEALVGRLPVYLKDEKDQKVFWGMVSVTLKYPEALYGADLDQLHGQGVAYELWRINPDTNKRQVIASNTKSSHMSAHYVEQKLNLFHSEWYFRIALIKVWYQYAETWICIAASILISVLLAFLVKNNSELKRVASELEDIVKKDALTGVLNRRGFMNLLNEMIAVKKMHFVLCYIDLNKFKIINDKYGHEAGDCVLRETTRRFRQFMKEDDIFSRIGGDEFILVFQNTENLEESKRHLDRIKEEFKKAIQFNETDSVILSFSSGWAVYPDDGNTVNELLAVADKAMYEEKNKSFII